MHENRIAGLEKRLRNLAAKAGSGRYPAEVLERDREATQEELVTLRGIRDRNAALVIQAPEIAQRDATATERRRSLRERAQFTPGQGPTKGKE